ncbi:hypothetical protein [Acinetobacter sp. WZC-1]|uniref:hypothetical protein n=1 Tax=Acinetobacter sp. WZC-1 TaxID=3459034 RepID=UPI00403DF5C7
MKKTLLLILTTLTLSSAALAQNTALRAEENMPEVDTAKTPVCLLEVAPADSKFTVIKRLKLGKGTYGGVEELYPRFAESARKLHADAIINYRAGQRFGFWPWRIVRPVVSGTAIQWQSQPPIDCTAMGGKEIR